MKTGTKKTKELETFQKLGTIKQGKTDKKCFLEMPASKNIMTASLMAHY